MMAPTTSRLVVRLTTLGRQEGRLLVRTKNHPRGLAAAVRLGRIQASYFSTKIPTNDENDDNAAASISSGEDHWSEDKVSGYFGHNFPDFIEHWNRETFRRVGYFLGGSTSVLATSTIFMASTSASTSISMLSLVPTVALGALTATYWKIGLRDMQQPSHAIRRNYPVLGNMRYIFETVRRVFYGTCLMDCFV